MATYKKRGGVLDKVTYKAKFLFIIIISLLLNTIHDRSSIESRILVVT